jgi:glycosyltransferase involved in cell wall biosynthesis
MLEAMQEGIPIIASDIAPHCQLLGDDRGVLFRTSEVESLTQALKWAIANSAELQTMAQKAQRYVQMHHCWEQITSEHLRLYTALVSPPVRQEVSALPPGHKP